MTDRLDAFATATEMLAALGTRSSAVSVPVSAVIPRTQFDHITFLSRPAH